MQHSVRQELRQVLAVLPQAPVAFTDVWKPVPEFPPASRKVRITTCEGE